METYNSISARDMYALNCSINQLSKAQSDQMNTNGFFLDSYIGGTRPISQSTSYSHSEKTLT